MNNIRRTKLCITVKEHEEVMIKVGDEVVFVSYYRHRGIGQARLVFDAKADVDIIREGMKRGKPEKKID